MSSPKSQRNYLVKRSYSTPCDSQEADLILDERINKTPTNPPPNKHKSPINNANNAKMIAIKILLLDDSVTIIQAQTKALGRLVFDQICKQLNVLEADYFGLEYQDENGVTYWLDLEKRLTRQVGLNMSDALLKFSVKFYTPDPSQLEEEFTRYLFSLQIKRDLATSLQCNNNTAALMASFIVQAECGDYSDEDYPDASYLSVYKFVPQQNYELERKIRENHKKHIGQSPAEADLHLLETARRTELYGVRMHPAKDEDGVNLNLSVCHMGILVFQNMTKINTFSWAKIRKISFKRKRFILKLHPETYFQEQGYYKELVEFIFESRNECKSYWKRCVEHHAFFRCEKAPNPIHRSKGILSSRGSSFRYSGRTQKQMVAFVRENFVKRPLNVYHSHQNLHSSGGEQQLINFQRSSSFKGNQQQGGQQGSSQLLVSNSKSSPAITNAEDPRQRYNNQQEDDEELEEDEEDEEEEEFSDYVVEKKAQTPLSQSHHPHSHPHQHTHEEQSQKDSPGESTSVTSSPLHPSSVAEGKQIVKNELLPPDWYYYISKELLNTYHTYKRDLVLLSKHYKNLPLLSPTVSLTRTFKQNIGEIKKERWESRNGHEIIHQLLKYFQTNIQIYLNYFNHVTKNYEEILKDSPSSPHYIGLCCLYLRPYQFVKYIHIDLIPLLLKNSTETELVKTIEKMQKITLDIYNASLGKRKLLNVFKASELHLEMRGFPNVNTVFVRQGILLKLNKKRGLQNRIFFLFVDVLAYGSRISSSLGFRLHGLIKTSHMELNENSQVEISGIPHSFVVNINNGQTHKILVLAAFNDKDKRSWTLDIEESIKKTSGDFSLPESNTPNYNSSEEFLSLSTEQMISPFVNNNLLSHNQHRSNATTHVCWHRNLSISAIHILNAYECTISGYLLRKFKNSPGWQRLWVVYTNICLYFYKTHGTEENEENEPLASLPLLGYEVSLPSPSDNINKDLVFKLSFKNHVYFFRAESPFTFNRWIHTIKTSTLL